tara:strand:- start:5958 stop:6188 length:231 start_codon:yes stop_codon:yes gene_type:complete
VETIKEDLTEPICSICSYRHKDYDDGLDYLTCMKYLKWGKKQNTTKSRSNLTNTDIKQKIGDDIPLNKETTDMVAN